MEIDMSKIKCITTPLPIMVGQTTYSFITFEDLFDECRKDEKLFPEMKKAPQDLGNILERRRLVLAVKCIESLKWLLAQKELVAIAEALLKNGTPWPVREIDFWRVTRSMKYTGPCTWPNCPSD
jgi:hypothetical protein